MIRISVIIATIIAAVVMLIFRWWGAVGFAIFIPGAIWLAILEVRHCGYARLPGGIAFRSGVWTRKLSATFHEKIQTIKVAESPFDRRWRMASLRIDTAGAGPADHVISIPYLARSVAADLLHDLAARAQRSDFRW